MTTPPGAPGGTDDGSAGTPPGPLGEEAARLLEAVQTWIAAGASMAGVGGSEECKVCPVCQLLRVLATTRPEVAGHLGDAAGSLVAAMRTAIETAQASWSAGTPRQAQHIDIE